MTGSLVDINLKKNSKAGVLTGQISSLHSLNVMVIFILKDLFDSTHCIGQYLQ